MSVFLLLLEQRILALTEFQSCRSFFSKKFSSRIRPYGIRVNAIAPGLIKTEFSRALWSDKDKLKNKMKIHHFKELVTPRIYLALYIF